MKTLLNISIITILTFVQLDAQETNSMDFFPSAVGNYWEYDTEHGHLWTVIAKDSLDEYGNKYLYRNPNADPRYKIDTSLFVHYIPFGLNWKIYKLDADSGDTWTVYPEDEQVQRQDALL